PAWSGERHEHLQHDLVTAVRSPDLLGRQTVPEVPRKISAQAECVAFGVSVQGAAGLGHCGGDVADHRFAWRIGIFVDGETDRHIVLGRSVGLLADPLWAQREILECRTRGSSPINRGNRHHWLRVVGKNLRAMAAPCAGKSSASANTSTFRATSANAALV